MDMKKLVATVALAGTITAGTAGAAFAADSGSSTATTDPSAQTGKAHPGRHHAVRRGAFKTVLDTLGGSKADLRAALQGGQSISEYATSLGKDPQAVVTALVSAANTKIDQLVADGTLSSDRGATMKSKVPERVDTFVNRVFDQQARA